MPSNMQIGLPPNTQEFAKLNLKKQYFYGSLQKVGGIWYIMQFLLYLNIQCLVRKKRLLEALENWYHFVDNFYSSVAQGTS
uniref:Uncharacterized protein n=1 Tax=Lepeophtheirus salmonis TaxID=72036 RepID=A0A0K2UHL7_LEPSM